MPHSQNEPQPRRGETPILRNHPMTLAILNIGIPDSGQIPKKIGDVMRLTTFGGALDQFLRRFQAPPPQPHMPHRILPSRDPPTSCCLVLAYSI